MRKVVESKPTINQIFLTAGFSLEALIFLLTCGCAPKNENTQSAKEPTAIEQLVNNGDGTANSTMDTPLPTVSSSPSETPVDASLITPEATPAQTSYFLLLPSEDELKLLEKEAENYYKRLKGNYCTDIDYKNNQEDRFFEIAKNLCGCFDNIDFISCTTDKELDEAKEKVFESNINGVFKTFIVINMYRAMEVANGDAKNVGFSNIKTINVIKTIKSDNYPGALTLDLLEGISESINNSIKNKNNEDLMEQTKKLLTLLELIFLRNGGNYNGTEITAFKDMYPTIKLLVKREASAVLGAVLTILKTYEIKADESSEYSIKDLYEIVISEEIDEEIRQEIFALMDAYIEAVKNGEIVVAKNDEEGIVLEYTPSAPSPTPGS